MSVLTSIISFAPVHIAASPFSAHTDLTWKIFPWSTGKSGSCRPRGSVVMMRSIAGFSPFSENLINFIRCLVSDRRVKWRFKNGDDLQRRMLRPKLTRGRIGDGSGVYCCLLTWRWHGAAPRRRTPAQRPCRAALSGREQADGLVSQLCRWRDP